MGDPVLRTLLICHEGDRIGREVLPRWLASFSTPAGVVVVRETAARKWRRVRNEVRRVGPLRFLDVLAFRAYYALALSRRDRRWEDGEVRRLLDEYPEPPAPVPVLYAPSPNGRGVERFIKICAPDLTVARCKTLLKKSVYSPPRLGTYVMHPGICPEYRNAHGCFWALARNDPGNVGMTLLRIDSGIDTGPVYGYYRCRFDGARDSHVVIQNRVVLDNLGALGARLREIAAGRAAPLDTSGRPSAEWGQPWLSAYWAWKRSARGRGVGHASGVELP
jgi:hypothetical protein